MGVIHKLKPEIKDYLLEQKKSNPVLSCRKLAASVLTDFKVELSKSSINAIIKEAGLSAPIGRRPKKKKQRIMMPALPALAENGAGLSVTGTPVARNDEEEAQKAAEEARQKAQVEAEEARQKEEAAKKAAEEREAQEEAERKSREEEARIREEEAAKKAEEEKKAQEEAERKSREEEARIREEEAAKKAEEEKAAREATQRRAREEDAMLRAEESARNAAEQKAKQAEEEAAQKAREEAAQQAEVELKKAAEEDIAKKAEEEKWAKLAEEERKASEGAGASVSVEKIAQLENSGIILLRAADAIIGVSKLIAGSLKNRLPDFAADLEGITEGIIYLPLLEGKLEQARIDRLSGYLKEIENIKVMDLDISRMMAFGLQEVRCVKVILSDSSNLYLDGSMYSVWSSPHIPYDFASPVHNLKRCIRKYFETEAPFILFNAPGYDIPSQEFFIFLAGLEARGISITNLVLYGNKFEELEVLPITQAKKRGFIFAIWPWQFTECRKVRSLGDFRKVRLEPQEKDFYLADIEMELRHPGLGKQVTLYGCALKQGLAEKTRLVVLSNMLPGEKGSEELAALYLNHWPNLEEAFQDYSRKIELFTYTANSQRYFNAEELNPGLAQVSSVKDLFRNYLTALDAYVRWHLLPSGYEDKEFAVAKERFYDLSVQLARGDRDCAASFILPEAGYAFEKDLAYLSRRLNEKEIILEGKRFLIKA